MGERSRIAVSRGAAAAHPSKSQSRPPHTAAAASYAAAAALLLAFITIASIFWFRPADLTIYTGHGEIRQLTLPDGSVVTLNALSSIRYNSSGSDGRRTVHLDGQAFFDVRQDATSPFVVISSGLQTEVLGTSFDLRAYPGARPFIGVASGKVRVKDTGGRYVILEKGQQAIYDARARNFTRLDANPSDMSTWQHGIISLDGLTLQDVCADLERWYGVKIILDAPGIGEYQLTGRQEVKSLESCLDAICFIFHLQYTYKDNTVRIRKN